MPEMYQLDKNLKLKLIKENNYKFKNIFPWKKVAIIQLPQELSCKSLI